MSIDTGGFNMNYINLSWENSNREKIARHHPRLIIGLQKKHLRSKKHAYTAQPVIDKSKLS